METYIFNVVYSLSTFFFIHKNLQGHYITDKNQFKNLLLTENSMKLFNNFFTVTLTRNKLGILALLNKLSFISKVAFILFMSINNPWYLNGND